VIFSGRAAISAGWWKPPSARVRRVSVSPRSARQPPMVSDDLRRQAIIFIELERIEADDHALKAVRGQTMSAQTSKAAH